MDRLAGSLRSEDLGGEAPASRRRVLVVGQTLLVTWLVLTAATEGGEKSPAAPGEIRPSSSAGTADRVPHLAPREEHTPFFRGISFSHEGWRSGGYGSDQAAVEIARIRALHADAIAVVPYAFTRAPAEATIHTETDETDDVVVQTFRQARKEGLRVALKPQLWCGHAFTGDIVFSSDEEFGQWFAQYRAWMMHYAHLAEDEHADLLVVGTELGGLTVRQGAWRELIRDMRRVYSGPLTYASHWDRELETVLFWDALDLIGVNMYAPLAAPGEGPSAGSPRMRELVARLEATAQRWRRPILFTEVGFPDSAEAAVTPWKERAAALDPALQERCYETIFEAFWRKSWFAGAFWWKWPSNGGGGRFPGSFSPLGKPALGVIEKWYARDRAVVAGARP